MFIVPLMTVYEDFVTVNYSPVRLKLIRSCFKVTLALENFGLFFFVVSEALKDHFWI